MSSQGSNRLRAHWPRGWAVVCLTLTAVPLQAGEFHLPFDEGKGTQTVAVGEPTLSGQVVNAQWVEGRQGSALQFNDYSNELVNPKVSEATYVLFAHHEALVPTKKVSITAAVWLERKPFYYGGIVEKGQGFGATYRLMVLRDGTVKAAVGNQMLSVTSPEPLPLEEWHELKMTYDGSRLALAIDGEEVAHAEGTVESFANTDPLVVGTRLTGKLDEIQITLE